MSDKKLKIKPKLQTFDIKLETLVPTVFIYRVQAEDEEKALQELNKQPKPIQFKPNLQQRIKLKATVYQGYTNMIKTSKIYRGT